MITSKKIGKEIRTKIAIIFKHLTEFNSKKV